MEECTASRCTERAYVETELALGRRTRIAWYCEGHLYFQKEELPKKGIAFTVLNDYRKKD